MNAWNRLLRLGAAVLLLGLLTSPALAADAAEFFVAPDGNDNWQGTKDRPLATLERARDKVRELKKSQGGALKAPVRVVLRGGEYVLPAPLTLTPEDSGSDQAPIVYAAWPGETPVLSGGRVIRDWKPAKVNDKDCWVADLAAQGLKDAFIKELFVYGARRQRARLPKQGYFRFDPATPRHAWEKGPESARFVKGDLKNWSNLPDVEMIILNRWFDIHARIARVEETTPTVHFASRLELGLYDSKNLPARYWVENVREALTEPGEWYYDRPAAKLYYLPQPGENPGKTQVIVPGVPALLVVDGKANAPVRYLRFERLTFRYATPPVTKTSVQTAVNVPGIVILRGAEHCTLYACAVEKVGGYGVGIEAGSADCRIVACRLQELGAGGVRIDSGSRHTVVSDCTIRDGGRLWLNGAGVYIQNSGWNRVVHNHIHDLNQIGVACGWTWGYAHTETVDNRIEFNRIHDLGKSLFFDDLSGIYTLGAQPGGVLRGNVIHDIKAYEYGAWGLYTDEGSAYLTLENNIVYRADLGGFHQHYGRDNLVRNNIFALSELQGLQKTRAEAIRSFTFEKNIVLAAPGAKLLHGKWGDGHSAMRDNVFWRHGGGWLDFAGQSLEEWQKQGRDAGSVLADPCFIDPTGGDFTLAPWSPAPGKGFRPLDASQAGPRLLDPAATPFEKWPLADETPKVILEGRLETVDSLARHGGARFDKALPLTSDHPTTASYVLVNRGPLPAKGEVEFRIEPSGAAALEGNPTLKYELKPGERAEARFKLVAAPGQKTPPCRLEANAKGEGLFSSVIFFN